ncbi:hypothetical protein [Bacteriovorax sp. Seq25_V]|uniref:hypothetical protein n=1 Tax=Bacteriovorax sp. Seq25_V TaxID=1201288 RepID=UPI000389E153|nr:hypothetical protein [Bacteriovorax sp. Seq25_V]EQC43797.1 hypothetical protein M900_1177 [Bacteriovorax sp. Seq25_V]
MKIFILLLLSYYTLGCANLSTPENINIAIDPQNGTHYFYNDLRLVFDRPNVSASNCEKVAKENKYLMFSVGLENFILSDEFMTYSINDYLSMSGDMCKIDNNPSSFIPTKEDRNKRLIKRRKFLNQCVVFQLTDFSRTGIDVPSEQPGCKITEISQNAVNFEGSFCFVKPKVDSSIVFTVDIKDECKSFDYYKENKIELQDILGNITVYKSGDATGKSIDLTSLKQMDFRISVNSPKDLIPTNVDYGDDRPTWPTTWNVSDLYLGEPKILTGSDLFDEITVPVFANNNCPLTCKEGLCASSCTYSQPVTGEFLLYEVNGSKKELLASWFDGGIVPANWAGYVNGVGVKIQKELLQEGKDYVLEYDISDQELNYMSLKGRITKQIKMNANNIPELRRGGLGIREIPQIGTIGEIKKLPMIDSIVGIYFSGSGFNGVRNALNSISRTFKSSFWPPYFDKVCTDSKCIDQKKSKLKLSLGFKLLKKNKGFKISDVNFSKTSNFSKDIHISDYKFPKINCGLVQDDSDGPDFDDVVFDF